MITETEATNSAATAFRAVEGKGHAKYIRYLLSKRMPLETISRELTKLGFSSPTQTNFTIYFETVIYPLAQEKGVHKYYTTYLKRLRASDEELEALPLLNFEMAFKDHEKDRLKFCAFLKSLEIDAMWSSEITRYYGTIKDIPLDENGEQVIDSVPVRSMENVLTCPRRYVIDKLLLDDVPPHRIVRYMQEKYQIRFNNMDVYQYANYFFNFRRREVEEVIDTLVEERNDIEKQFQALENDETLSLGDKLSLGKMLQEKIEFLEDSTKELNARYSDLTYRQGADDKVSIQEILTDVLYKSYSRFKMLDKATDRDVVKPISDVSKMIFTAIDKLNQVKSSEIRAEKSNVDRDKSAQEVLLGLYQERYEVQVTRLRDEAIGDDEDIEIDGLDEV